MVYWRNCWYLYWYYNKTNKEWFIVQYNKNKKKHIQRLCKDIKPIDSSTSNDNITHQPYLSSLQPLSLEEFSSIYTFKGIHVDQTSKCQTHDNNDIDKECVKLNRMIKGLQYYQSCISKRIVP